MKKQLLFLILFGFVTTFCSQTIPLNSRTFETNLFGEYPGLIKHVNENNSETFYAAFNYNNDLLIKRFSADGILKWKATFTSAESYDLSPGKHIVTFDKNDNVLVCFTSSGAGSSFIDVNGTSEYLNITAYNKLIVKLDKTGKLIWKTKIDFLNFGGERASVYTDNNGDVIVVGTNQYFENGTHDQIYIMKLDGSTGNMIFKKNYAGFGVYSTFSIIDNQNNLYVFLDAYTNQQNYNFDGVIINKNFGGDNLMLKFNSNGDLILGKNFYTNNDTFAYSILSDGIFDGENINLVGILFSFSNTDFLGLDNTFIPRKYPMKNNQGLLAKIDLMGNVLWQKPLYSNVDINDGIRTNLDIDTGKNIYAYFYFKDKVSISDVEYQFDATAGNKVISKFNSNGEVQYLKAVDVFRDVTNGGSSTAIDVIANDVFNCSGVTSKSNFLNYPLINRNIAKNYIATFGALPTKYFTPQKNYLELTNIPIANNLNNVNAFAFNLINNVNWSATSDQSWLTISSLKLAQKNSTTTITVSGDAEISIKAETNNSGATRTANVLLSGDGGVAAKTIAVTQSGVLETGETKTFVTTLYPNPTSDVLNIETKQNISKIEIFDMTGKLLKSGNGKDKKISVSQLNKGMYIIKLYTENGVVNSKFSKN